MFYRSGWTQEQLAKVEGCSVAQVSRRLRFGQFLAFLENSPMGEKSEITTSKLIERRFRDYWERTDPKDNAARSHTSRVRPHKFVWASGNLTDVSYFHSCGPHTFSCRAE